jgi:hypothetical protein
MCCACTLTSYRKMNFADIWSQLYIWANSMTVGTTSASPLGNKPIWQKIWKCNIRRRFVSSPGKLYPILWQRKRLKWDIIFLLMGYAVSVVPIAKTCFMHWCTVRTLQLYGRRCGRFGRFRGFPPRLVTGGWKHGCCLCRWSFVTVFWWLCGVYGMHVMKPPMGNLCRWLLGRDGSSTAICQVSRKSTEAIARGDS